MGEKHPGKDRVGREESPPRRSKSPPFAGKLPADTSRPLKSHYPAFLYGSDRFFLTDAGEWPEDWESDQRFLAHLYKIKSEQASAKGFRVPDGTFKTIIDRNGVYEVRAARGHSEMAASLPPRSRAGSLPPSVSIAPGADPIASILFLMDDPKAIERLLQEREKLLEKVRKLDALLEVLRTK